MLVFSVLKDETDLRDIIEDLLTVNIDLKNNPFKNATLKVLQTMDLKHIIASNYQIEQYITNQANIASNISSINDVSRNFNNNNDNENILDRDDPNNIINFLVPIDTSDSISEFDDNNDIRSNYTQTISNFNQSPTNNNNVQSTVYTGYSMIEDDDDDDASDVIITTTMQQQQQ